MASNAKTNIYSVHLNFEICKETKDNIKNIVSTLNTLAIEDFKTKNYFPSQQQPIQVYNILGCISKVRKVTEDYNSMQQIKLDIFKRWLSTTDYLFTKSIIVFNDFMNLDPNNEYIPFENIFLV